MALGGGTFITQNKTLPGSYINFVSRAKASAALADRGYGAMGLDLNWGPDNEVFEVTNGDFQKYSRRIFGYDYTHEKLKGLRDLFSGITTLYAYKLTSGGEKASCSFGTAKYTGTRGNDLKLVIQEDIDKEGYFNVMTLLDNTKIDEQTVTEAKDLMDNEFIVFKKDAELKPTAGEPLTGGTDGTVDGAAHQAFLDKIEAYSFNAIGAVTNETAIKGLYANFCKRMRDEVGMKFQAVLYNYPGDYEGVINVKNKVQNEQDFSEASLIYWVTGVSAGCAVNKSNLNKKYDGEFTVEAEYSQSQLEAAINAGEFAFHQVGSEIRVLSDINSLVTVTDEKGDIFKENQTVRVIDQIANDIAVIFNTRYLGVVANDKSGRISLWADIVKHHEQLQDIRAIEDFSEEDVQVVQGDAKNSVVVQDAVCVINAMAKLYMTVTIE